MNEERVSLPELPSFLERFSRGHRGWITHVNVLDDTARGEIQTTDRPLSAIVADDAETMLVLLDSDRGIRGYRIDRPTEVWREKSGATLRLDVASAGGTRTIIECHPVDH